LTGIQLAVFWIDELVEEGIGEAIPGSQEYTAAQDTTERKSCIRVHYGPTLDTLFIRILTGLVGTCSSCRLAGGPAIQSLHVDLAYDPEATPQPIHLVGHAGL